jgi:hypothetical protein
MTEREVMPLAPRRRELPCEFSVAKHARISTLVGAGFAVGIGVMCASCGGFGVRDGAWIFLLGGLVFLAEGVFFATKAFVRVRIDDEGLLIRRPGRVRRVPWTDVRRIAFGANRTGGRRGLRLPGVVVHAAFQERRWTRDEGPYYFGRVRPEFEPFAYVSTSGRSEEFTETLGWAFFLALFAEAGVRGIEIVRTL